MVVRCVSGWWFFFFKQKTACEVRISDVSSDVCSSDLLRGTALAVAVQEGGKAAFDAAERHFRASQDAVLRSQLLSAMGGTDDAALNARVRALVFEESSDERRVGNACVNTCRSRWSTSH